MLIFNVDVEFYRAPRGHMTCEALELTDSSLSSAYRMSLRCQRGASFYLRKHGMFVCRRHMVDGGVERWH